MNVSIFLLVVAINLVVSIACRMFHLATNLGPMEYGRTTVAVASIADIGLVIWAALLIKEYAR